MAFLILFLQEEYKTAVTSGVWHKPIQFDSGETVVMHNSSVMVHYLPSSQPDEWGNVQVCIKPFMLEEYTLSCLIDSDS